MVVSNYDLNRVSRAILLTNGPIRNTGGKVRIFILHIFFYIKLFAQLTLLNIPPYTTGEGQSYVVRVLQLDSSTNTAVDGTCKYA